MATTTPRRRSTSFVATSTSTFLTGAAVWRDRGALAYVVDIHRGSSTGGDGKVDAT
jgi:hypothetical protein